MSLNFVAYKEAAERRNKAWNEIAAAARELVFSLRGTPNEKELRETFADVELLFRAVDRYDAAGKEIDAELMKLPSPAAGVLS